MCPDDIPELALSSCISSRHSHACSCRSSTFLAPTIEAVTPCAYLRRLVEGSVQLPAIDWPKCREHPESIAIKDCDSVCSSAQQTGRYSKRFVHLDHVRIRCINKRCNFLHRMRTDSSPRLASLVGIPGASASDAGDDGKGSCSWRSK